MKRLTVDISLHERMILFILFVALPALILVLIYGSREQKNSYVAAEQEALRAVRLASQGQEHLLDSTHQLLVALSHLPEVKDKNSTACSILFADLLAQYPIYSNLGAASRDGDIFCSGIPLRQPVNVSDRTYFQGAVRAREYAIGEYQIGRITGAPTLNMGYPVFDAGGQVQAVVYAALNLDWLNELLENADLPENSSFTVIDQKGTILARYPDPEKYMGQEIAEQPIYQAVLAGKNEGTAVHDGPDRVSRLFAYKLSGEKLDWAGKVYIAVGIPKETIFAEANRIFRFHTAGLGLVTIFVLVVGWFGLDFLLLRPLNTLLRSTRKLAAGDLSTRASICKGPKELRELGHGFDQMAASLERQVTEIRQSHKALQESEDLWRTLVNANPESTFLIEPDGTIIAANQAVARRLGKTVDQVVGTSIYDLIEPEVTEKRKARIDEAIRSGTPVRFEEHCSGCYLDIYIHPILNLEGQVSKLAILDIDVTTQKLAEERIRQEAARAEALLRVASLLNAQLDLRTVLEVVCEETTQALRVPAACVLLADEKNENLYIASDVGCPAELRQHHHPIPVSVFEQVFDESQTVFLYEDIAAAPDGLEKELLAALEIHTAGVASMKRQGELVGALNIYSYDPKCLTHDELDLFKGLANQASQAITNARLYEEIRRQAYQLGMLYDVGLALNSVLEPRAQLEYLLNIAMNTLDADRAGYYRFDSYLNELQPDLIIGYSKKHIINRRKISLESENLCTGWVGKNRLPLNIPSVQTDPRFIPLSSDTQCLLVVPVERQSQLLGVLYMARTQPRPFTSQDERLLMLFANQAAVAMENARLLEEVKQNLSRVEALHKIDRVLTSNIDLVASIDAVLEQVRDHLQMDAADVLVFNPNIQLLEYVAGQGFRTPALRRTQLHLGEGYAGQAALEKRSVHVLDLPENANELVRSPLLAEEKFRTYFALPLVTKGVVKGVLEIFHRSEFRPDEEWLSFLETLAHQAAIAIENTQLFSDLKQAKDELTQSYEMTIEGWSRALDLRDKETEGHSQRVTEMTIALARKLGVADSELVHIRRGALLHDIGKVGIPDSILLKPDPLNDEEWEIMRQHPMLAYRLLSPLTNLRLALDIPYCHHEKWDGSGYPRGLKGKQIPFAARIFTVVDVFDALLSDRPYRPAWERERVLKYIKDESGKQFDPRVVKAFLEMVREMEDAPQMTHGQLAIAELPALPQRIRE